jgi:NAD(P)-dependent dehydrogenase (short-subunit alcohol dehydrogenase family)
LKSILVTGASTGIGYHLAQQFSRKGYHVYASVRKEADAERLKNDVGNGVTPLLFDVTDSEAIHEAAAFVAKDTGTRGLSGLINNAGIAVTGPVMHIGLEEYRKQFEVNLFGTIEVTKAFLPLLGAVKDAAHPPGKILNISSVSGSIGYPFMSPYNASKFALEGFSEALRRELMMYGIDVIVVAPGSIKTPIWDKNDGFPQDLLNSDYAPALKRFMRRAKRNGETGMDVEVFADRVVRIFEKKKPAVRYTILNNKLKMYIMPKYLIPTRTVDRIIFKMFR